MFQIRVAVYSHVGLVRMNNEDNFYLENQINDQAKNYCYASAFWEKTGWHCAGVFDGMGGEADGEIASRIAAQTLAQCTLEKVDFEKAGEWNQEKTDLRIRGMILESNRKIVEYQEQCHHVSGTTAVIFCTDGRCFKIYHCGDSRAYLMRDQALFCLTRDQTLAALKIEAGIYTADDPVAAYEKHKLMTFLGCDRTKKHLLPEESEWITLEENDQILLCSDGLTDLCSEEKICQILKKEETTQEKCFQLMESAVRSGGKDNVTCLLIKAGGSALADS